MNRGVVLLFLCVTMFGCEKEITYNIPGEEPKNVIYAFLEKDSTLKLQLNQSVSVVSSISSESANVGWISFFKDSTLVEKKHYNGDSKEVVFPDVILQDSASYQIEFATENGAVLSASTYIPSTVSISDVDTVQMRSISKNLSDSTMLCKIWFKDRKNISNYYQLVVNSIVVDGSESKSSEILFSKDDKLFLSSDQVDGVWKGVDFEGLFTDKGIEGIVHALNITIPSSYFVSKSGQIKKVEFRLYSLSYQYFEYYKSRKIADGYSGLPFLDPVKIYSNVSNGEGCFGGLSINSYFLNAVP